MSLITRCPACETMFRVESGQLRVSEGWVRCGRCHQAFNAPAHLINLPDVTMESHLPVSSATKAADQPVAVGATDGAADPSPAPNGEDASFLATDSPVAEPAVRPWARVVMVATIWLLGFTFLVQILVQERDQIIAHVPSVRQTLESVCQVLRCPVPLARQIDAVAVDGVAFNRLDEQAYQLSFTLRNTASIDVALPALELTLTDSRDETLVRRVLQPRELELDTRALRASSELNGKLILNIDFPAESTGPAGYRLVAFYL